MSETVIRAGRPRRRNRPLWRTPGLLFSVLVLGIALSWALVPGWWTAYDPVTGVPADRLLGPSAAHFFGTDETGRDVFARVVHGASLSLRATVIAVFVALVAGSLLGLVAGYRGGWADSAIMRVVDVLLAIPSILLSLALVTALGFGTTNVAIAVGVSRIADFARLMRAETLRVRSSVYVEAARVSGLRWPGVLARHVLPNAFGPVLVLAVLTFGTAVLEVSALSFLGFGAMPPAPEWGSLVSSGRGFLATAWWLTTFPGLAIAAVVLAGNRVARAIDRETEQR
ncbi:peptide ABC transporter permease [Prauserella marina]|uniref:Peptide/nickel transport system permease protein n=1 Tax=Prauserella marina TaxID=530584 RepID=A0A222VR12_9PSEU|nr:ABC transporter permease [Prauserella marina]ASR36375.1 peptide ABC transporter permease [Prauserella marina]PWV77172.1 peptide/nickel transport system permease protein [Prauserella marina]SDD06054.1 peptide/nickel transport system permease protein [Prauserella marina]